MKVKPSLVDVVLLGFDDQGANMLSLTLDLMFLALSRRQVVPLYTWVDACPFTESRGRLINVSGSVSALSILQHKFTYRYQFMSTSLEPALGPGPS